MPYPPLPNQLPARLQDIPAPQARLCLDVGRFMTEQLAGAGCISREQALSSAPLNGYTMLAACSGGADSTALLLILHYLAPRMGHTVVAVHLDHALRQESADDARFVSQLCSAAGIRLFSVRTDVADLAAAGRCGLEEAGRKARYAFYARTAALFSRPVICTGHHADDLKEDVLMRLIRGAGWPALGGMQAVIPERSLLRPLLVTEKNKLTAFLEACRCPWREDASNSDPSFTRNRIRNTIIPLLQQENPSFGTTITELWEAAAADRDYWTDVLPELAPDKNGQIFIARSTLQGLHKAGRLRLYKKALEALGAGQPLHASIMALEHAWHRNQGGKCIQFPGGKTARIRHGGICFCLTA